MLYLGLILGCVAGLLVAVAFVGRRPPLENFFLRFVQRESKSMRVDTRVMFHELHHKVEELSAKMQRMDVQIQDLMRAVTEEKALNHPFETAAPFENEGGVSFTRSLEVAALIKEGLTPEEIAERLNVGRGEVDLILSLGKKPSWVVNKDNK